MDSDIRYAIARGIAYRDVGGKIVLINPKNNTLLTLNPTASEVWRGLAKGQGVPEVIGPMLDRYSASQADIRRDVTSFLEAMTSRGILESHAG